MLTQGEILRNRYKVIRQLGQGGMGAVYEAHDNVFDTSVALKEVTINISSAYDTKAQEMAQLAFEREAKILAKVNHENVPHVKDYFTEEGAQFLVMELVDGDDLGKLLNQQKSPFPIASVLEWTDRILDALEYLHSQNPPVIHRDIKPQNLKLTSRKKIKLLDFGIAKGTDSTAANTVTNQTFVAATLNYSPLEQMLRVLDPTFLAVITHKYGEQIEAVLEQNADARTDLFALGATMYHLATNVPPSEAVKRAIDVWDGKPDPLENPVKLNPEISGEFAAFLLKSMEIRREKRFNSADEMRNALQKVIETSANPTLKKTVEMSYNEFQSQETAVFDDITAQKTEVFDNGLSQETAFINNANDQKTEFYNPDTGNQGIPTPLTNEIEPPPDTSVGQFNTGNQQYNTGNQQFNTGNQVFDTGGRNFVSNQNNVQQKKSKAIWLLPVAALLLLMLGGGAFGVWYVMSSNTTTGVKDNSNNPVNSNNSNTETVNTNSNTKDTEPTTGQQGVGLPVNSEEQPVNTKPDTPTTNTPVTTQPTQKPATPRPTEIAKPNTPKPTPIKKATPKPKSMDCIFTDDCE